MRHRDPQLGLYLHLALQAYQAMFDPDDHHAPALNDFRKAEAQYASPNKSWSDGLTEREKTRVFENLRSLEQRRRRATEEELNLAVRKNLIRQIRYLIDQYKAQYAEEFDRSILPILQRRFGAMFIEELEDQETLDELLNCLKTIKSRVLSAEANQSKTMDAQAQECIDSGRESL
jgi:hypothetical protein